MFLLLTLNKPIFAESHQINGNFSTVKEQIQPGILSNSLFFLEHELLQGDIIVTNYDTSFVSGMYILKHVCYLRTSVTAIHFLHCHSFTVALEVIQYIKGTVFISQLLLQPSIIKIGLWFIRENLKGAYCVYLRKVILFLLIQRCLLLQRTYAVIFV